MTDRPQPDEAADDRTLLTRLGTHPADFEVFYRRHEVADVPDGEVMWGYAVDPATVSFDVRPDGAVFDPAYYAPRLSDLPCTADQAAAWD